MNKMDASRRKFLGRAGAIAAALPVAAAVPMAIEEVASPTRVQAAVEQDIPQLVPNRAMPSLNINPANVQTVPASTLATDQATDCSQAIQNVIDSVSQAGGGTVIIPNTATVGPHEGTSPTKPCVYMIDPQYQTVNGIPCALYLKPNVRLQFARGVKLQALTINRNGTTVSRAYMVYGDSTCTNVEIANGWFVGERYTHVYSAPSPATDEWCYGIALMGVNGVNIRATLVSDCTGDGICIGASSTNVTMCDVISTGNRRQALSLTGCSNINLYESEFSYTSGTAPGDGIDIEPQTNDSVSNVQIENCVIRGNAANGIEVNATGTQVTNVNVVNCLITYNGWGGIYFAAGSGGACNGGTIYGNVFFQNGGNGVYLQPGTSSYTVGDPQSGGGKSNVFVNNVTGGGFTYPNTVGPTPYQGVGTGMSVVSGNTVLWNLKYTH